MKRVAYWIVACILLWCMAATPVVPADIEPTTIAQQGQPNLQRILDDVSKSTKRRFLVAAIPRDISWYGIDEKTVTYPILLTILADNGLGAIEADGIVHIVVDANLRQFPTPLITERDLATDRFSDNQVVTIVLHPKHVDAIKLIPVLRPLMPQWSQLSAATEENSFIMVDRVANVRRVANIIGMLDQVAPTKGATQQ